MATTSIRPGHPYGTPDNDFWPEAEEDERQELIGKFYGNLDRLLQEVTGDPTIEYIPATAEVMFECRGHADEDGHCLDPKHPWKANPDWRDIWDRA